jgi:hypothetical protein
VTPDHLLEDGDGTKAGGGLQEGHDLGLEEIAERIGTASAARRLLHRRQSRIMRQAVAGRGAER